MRVMTRVAFAVLMSSIANKATAKELEATLDVPAAVAEAIVAYRGEKGEFKTVEDVKKVPGLESATIEARKARIVF
jgi:competence protein ComEA